MKEVYNYNDLWMLPRKKWKFINFYLIAYNHSEIDDGKYRSVFFDRKHYINELVNILEKYVLFEHRYFYDSVEYCAKEKLNEIVNKYIFNPWQGKTTIKRNLSSNKIDECNDHKNTDSDSIISFFANNHLKEYFNSYFRNPFTKNNELQINDLVAKKIKQINNKFNKFIIICTNKDDEEMHFLPDMLTGHNFLQRPFIKDDIEIYINRIR